ncbi:NAD-dependent epimerase/dehydratase family protein [Luteibacter sp. PPL201]|uniref:NAD-dependent epimerase/dehydratase family protein n=1 Tax=Luteibacter sahnii TaxID=3021977 RepID=A0ABT6B732_9GAMM|nr:NAD-dependent epimerase/dehydratase family protein [Luteibacter sp. PPL193]MDY1548168.1 NAD-dependent epimerase/dehydratase family protein [Luteibacter sp. PPL193]
MTVLVIGATSQIGHFLLPRLREAGREMLMLSRQPPEGDPAWRRGHLPDAMPELPALDAILCCGPLNGLSAWLSATHLKGTPHVIALSSMSAETKRDSVVPSERELSQLLRESETVLMATCASRGMPWTVFRPTLVYGAGLDNSLTPVVHASLRRRMFPLPGGKGRRQPVHADDIAMAMVAALGCARARGHLFSIGGGERITAAEMFRRARRSTGQATLPVPVPRWVLRLGGLVWPGLKGSVGRLDDDLIADNTDLEGILSVHPRPFRPDPSSWRRPA